jgi:hypothetical protein
MSKKYEKNIFMPNEIFDDLANNIEIKQHIPFAYSYYYYINYLYRYCEFSADKLITQGDIKERLGYSAGNKKINYLISRDGLLDRIGYTMTTTNYPIAWYQTGDNSVEFKTLEEAKEEGFIPPLNERAYVIKHPIKAFYRTDEDEKINGQYTGTFYKVENTHMINYRIFNAIMDNEKELGTNAFYLYGFIRHKNNCFGNTDFVASLERLENESNISKTTLKKYIKNLESYGLVRVKHEEFKLGEVGKSNSYFAKI